MGAISGREHHKPGALELRIPSNRSRHADATEGALLRTLRADFVMQRYHTFEDDDDTIT